MRYLCFACAFATLAVFAGQARADDPALSASARAYAIIVGSNAGGEGQQPLRFAERDAERVRAVLSELGSYEPAKLRLLRGPSPDALWRAFDETQAALARHTARGEPTVFVFYYSGHARAEALDLGDEQVSLAALRDRISALPSTLSVVVLDACQSGAYANIKGAAPAADFSVSSVARLTASGVAVLASSTATELSQESPKLAGSYFTHHLVTGLRGAADADKDGRVSLSEVYRYAYDHTLMSTAKSAVGRQHVTLQTKLRGQGDIPLTVPARGDADLRFPAAIEGTILIQRADTADVVAEIHKVRGKVAALALPAARYQVIVRAGQTARECDLTLGRGDDRTLAITRCPPAVIDETAQKHALPPLRRWALEPGFGVGATRSTAFTDRLEDFGYGPPAPAKGRLSLLAAYALTPQVEILTEGVVFGGNKVTRDTDGASRFEYNWVTSGLLVGGRLSSLPLGGWLTGYVELKAGVSLATTKLVQDEERVDKSYDLGYALDGAAGIHVMPWERFGFSWKLGWAMAPTMDNELGDTHDAGGTYTTVAARIRF